MQPNTSPSSDLINYPKASIWTIPLAFSTDLIRNCAIVYARKQKAATRFVTAFCSLWTSQGLNLGPPDYESVALTN